MQNLNLTDKYLMFYVHSSAKGRIREKYELDRIRVSREMQRAVQIVNPLRHYGQDH